MQAPIGGAEVRQVRSAKGRGPPGVGYVSMQDAGKRTLHRFCAPALGPPPKPSVSGFGGERTSKEAKRSFRRPWAETEQSGLCEDEGVLRGQALRTRDALCPELSRGCAPKRVFGFFLHEQKETRPQAKPPRLSGRDPTKGRICRNPPAKGGSAPKKREKEREEARLWRPPITICIWTPDGT